MTKNTKLRIELFKSFWNIQSTSFFCEKKSYNYFPTRSSLLAFSKKLNHPTFVKDSVIIFRKRFYHYLLLKTQSPFSIRALILHPFRSRSPFLSGLFMLLYENMFIYSYNITNLNMCDEQIYFLLLYGTFTICPTFITYQAFTIYPTFTTYQAFTICPTLQHIRRLQYIRHYKKRRIITTIKEKSVLIQQRIHKTISSIPLRAPEK